MKKEIKTGNYIKDNQTYTFNFYTDLTAINKMKFVNAVVGYVVSDNYNYVIKDMMFDFEIIHIFTDYDITEIKESEDSIGAIEDLLDTTNIVQIVKENMVDGLYDELMKAVDLNIQYKTGICNNDIIDSIERILDIVEDRVADIDTDTINQFAKIFNDISGKLTPDKILDAYSKSDLYKNSETYKKQQSLKNNQGLNVLSGNRKKK